MAGTRKRHGVAPLLSLSPMLTLLACPSVGANECPDGPCSEYPPHECPNCASAAPGAEWHVMKVSSCSTCALNGNQNDYAGEPCTCKGGEKECTLPSTLCKEADNASWDKLLLWDLGTGRTFLSCWLLDDNGVALSGPGLMIYARLQGPSISHSETVIIHDIVALDDCDMGGANLFQLNLKGLSAGEAVGTSCLEFEECLLILTLAPPPSLPLMLAPPPSLPPRAAPPPPPSPSPSPAGGSGDPHLHFAHGGRADFRGRDGARTQPLPFCAPRKRQSSSPPRVPSP